MKKFNQFQSLTMKYCDQSKLNGKVCEKRSELISQHFTNDDEILSIANFDSLGLLSIEICQKLPQPDFIVAVYAG